MSKCMTLADKTIEQKDTCKEIDAKDIVEFILEEALNSAVIFSDKGCNRIGDFNITEDFCQQFSEIPANSKSLEEDKIKFEQGSAIKDLNFISGETVDCSASLVTAKENLEFILDSLPKKDDKLKSASDCKIITEEALADNELRIENGQIHIEKNKSHNGRLSLPDSVRHEFYEKEDVIKDEKIEIEYFNDGKLNKIYVPLSKTPLTKSSTLLTSFCEQGSKEEHIVLPESPRNDASNTVETTQRPFAPFSTEELRQVWENANSSIVGGWDGDMSTQPEEVARIMEELSSDQVFSNSSADPKRPRTCEFGEESVKKMTKEIEEINFNQSRNTLEEFDPNCHPDGQGDADLDTKSFITKSKCGTGKSSKAQQDEEESLVSEDLKSKLHMNQSRGHLENPLSNDKKNEEILLSSQLYVYLNKSEEIINDEKEKKIEGTDKSRETLVKLTSTKPNAEEYLIELDSLSNKSISINQSENEKRGVCPSSDNLNTLVESKIGVTYGVDKINNKRSLDNSEDNVQSSLDGGSLQEKGEDATANRLKSEEEVNETEKQIDGIKSKTLLLSSCTGNSTFGHFRAQAQESEMSLRKSNKTSDLSLKDFKLFSESKDLRNVIDRTEHSKKSIENFEVLCDYGNDSNLLFRDSKSVTGTKPQDLATALNSKDQPQKFSKTETSTGMESRNEKIFEEILETDLFAGEREIQVSYCDAHLLTRMDGEISNPEIIIKSENYSPNTDLFGERLVDGFEDIANGNNIHLVLNKYVKEEDQNLNEPKSDEQQEEKTGTKEINLKSKELQKKYLTNQEEEYDTPTNAYFSENIASNGSFSITAHQTFKLHSQKMYLDSDLEPTSFEGNKSVLTDSDEALIDSAESVIQVIDPPENSNDEDSGTVSFSLLKDSSDETKCPSLITERVNISKLSISSNNERTLSQNENVLKRNVFSGMTTIGPMKNLDVDPKDLTGPDIDFGKMTRISSSRQLAKDIFPTDIKSTSSENIIEEHDSDRESSMTMEGERLEIGSLINRDIASLTKVQKVKEVMSYHPKADEDFEDDDTLTRPRLDLKDVESMTDDRFKMTEVNIPLLSFEMANSSSEADKEYLQGMHLVLNGNCFSNNPYYEDDFHNGNVQTYRNRLVDEQNFSDVKEPNDVEISEFESVEETREKRGNSIDDVNEKNKNSNSSMELSFVMNDKQGQAMQTSDKDSQAGSSTSHQKYGTLGSVFKKASSKIIRKEGDLFLRNSKSLPRDASRITTSDSIKSILEDCHSSATNVLKKSRSLLKSTQNIFKTMSQNRFGGQSSSTNLNRQRMTSSDTKTNTENTLGRNPSTFQWKEDLSKAKTIIKNNVGKTLKTLDRSSSHKSDHEISSQNKDLRLAVKNEEDLRVDRAENFRKLLPKSPLVYKSQFARSQTSVQSNVEDNFISVSTCDESGGQQRNEKKFSKILPDEESKEKTQKNALGSLQDKERKDLVKELIFSNEEKIFENDLTWAGKQSREGEAIQNQEEQQEYIVMETIQGLPTVNLENHSSETDHQKEKKSFTTESFEKTKGNDDSSENYQKEVSNYPQHTPTCGSPFESDIEEDKNVVTTLSEKKIRAKNKKFTARFRSFWSSAFGKVKTPPKNKDPF